MSRILFGNEDLHVELRVRTFMELCLKKDLYYDDAYLKKLTGLENYKESLLESSFDTSTTMKCTDKALRQQLGFEAGITSTIKPGTFSNMWHIFALANVIGCPIVSVYPSVSGSLVDRNYMNVRIVPEKFLGQSSDVAYLMWTHMQNTNLHSFVPNHFVPLLPVNTTKSEKSSCSSLKLSGTDASQKRNASMEQSTTNTKKTRYQGSFMYNSQFSPSWTQQWPCIIASSKSKSHFCCTVCQRTLSCAKQGVRDVKVHTATALHQNNSKMMKTQKTLLQTCASQQNTQDKVWVPV